MTIKKLSADIIHEIKQIFNFLVDTYHFSLDHCDDYGIHYTRSACKVVISYDPRSSELEIFLMSSPKACGKTGISISLAEIARLTQSQEPAIYYPRSQEELVTAAGNLARDLMKMAGPFLEHDNLWLLEIYNEALKANQHYYSCSQLESYYKRARTAYLKGDYQRVIMELERHTPYWPPSVEKLLSMARRKIESINRK